MNYISHEYEPSVGDSVENTNPSCKHYGSVGVVVSIDDLDLDAGKVATYSCENSGETWAEGDVLSKTLDQLSPYSVPKLSLEGLRFLVRKILTNRRDS